MDTFRIYKMIFIKTDSLTLIEIIKFVYLVHYKNYLMKHFYVFMLMLLGMCCKSQTYTASVSQDPEQPWMVTFTHNDWSFFDPYYDSLMLYVFIKPEQNSDGQNLWDDWGTFAAEMTWNDTVGARQATLNLKDYVFQHGGKIQDGNTISDFGYILIRKPESGDWAQTDDLMASKHGFKPFTLPVLSTSQMAVMQKSSIIDGKLRTSVRGLLTLSVYDFSGALIKHFQVKNQGQDIELNIPTKGNYILHITSEGVQETLKFRK